MLPRPHDAARKRLRFALAALPLLLAGAYLAREVVTGTEALSSVTVWAISLELIVPTALVLSNLLRGRPLREYWSLVLLCPCFLAPLSTLYPWVVAPSHLGVGFGGLPFFITWLTKYPNLGHINYEVLLGLLCVLGTGTMPVLFGSYVIGSKAPRLKLSAAILAVALIPFVAVLVRLDPGLLMMGYGGAPTIFSSEATPARFALGGPVMRFLAYLSMFLWVVLEKVRRGEATAITHSAAHS